MSEDTRALVEWLTENDRLGVLVATTTIAQGVNFPVSSVVFASHQYRSESGHTEGTCLPRISGTLPGEQVGWIKETLGLWLLRPRMMLDNKSLRSS